MSDSLGLDLPPRAPDKERGDASAAAPSIAGWFGKLHPLKLKARIDRLRAQYYVRMARTLSAAGRHDDADGLLAEAARRFPDDLATLISFASLARDRGDYASALERWENVGRLFPGCPAGFLGASSALLNLQRSEEAQRVLAEAARLFPEDPDVALEHGIALFRLYRFTEAEQALAAAVARLPNNARAARYFASVAMRRREWTEAMRRWRAAGEKFPGDPEIIYGEAQTKHGIWMDHYSAPASELGTVNGGDQATAASIQGRNETAAEDLRDSRSKLMFNFESLGCNCDLGRTQRYFGSEPLGLLRFARITLESLMAALQTRFEGVGSKESTELTLRDVKDREYFLTDRTHKFSMHTFVYVDQKDDQARFKILFDKHCRRLKFLKDKLIADLEYAEKIFVLRSEETMTTVEMKRLHDEICCYGPNTLLCVIENNASPAGTVQALERGLMVGYLEPREPCNLVLPTDTWLRICTSAAKIWQSWSV